jgi:soluble lytic murein transglycosylase-like protein
VVAATVVDQLIVKLGLDPKDFDKGTKRAAADVLGLEKDVKRSSSNMSASIVGFTGKLLGIATAAVAVKKVLGAVSDLSVGIRQLGIDSRNFGIAASEMRNFQNVGEMMGGTAEGVTRSIAGITKAVYDLAYNGQMSDSLMMLGRLGVQFQDTAGNARSFRDIVLDTESAVQKSMREGRLTRENANQVLTQAGFDPGLAQAMLAGNVGAQLAKQESRRQVDADVIDVATKWEQSAANRDQAVAAAGLRVLPADAATGTFLNNKAAAAADYAGTASLGGAAKDLGQSMSDAADRIEKGSKRIADTLEDKIGDSYRGMFAKGREHYEDQIQASASKYGLDPEVLAGVLSTESNFDPSARSPAGAVGIAQLMPKYFPKAGRSPTNDINDAARYLSQLRDDFQKDGFEPLDSLQLALSSYNAGQTRVRNAMLGEGPPLKQETLDYPGKVLGYAAGAVPTPNAQSNGSQSSSTKTDVQIGDINIHTAATDANGIASGIAGATKRKMQAAQADTGMQ